MSAFLITFKPSYENPGRGWPLESLQKLVGRCQTEGVAEEPWRFSNKKDVSLGNRVFLLVQGEMGPAIIGYGRIANSPSQTDTQWTVPIRFEALVDPVQKNFADRTDLDNIDPSHNIWNTQRSGILLPDEIASALEALVVGKEPKPISGATNPNWTRDELVVALDVYLEHRYHLPDKSSPEIANLSHTLNRLGQTLFSASERGTSFRNVNGVSMKLMNFRRLDPEYIKMGKKGLTRGAKADQDVWNEFAHDPQRCHEVAQTIIANLDVPESHGPFDEFEGNEDMQEAPEGRLLTLIHLRRERNRKLVENKRKQALKEHGQLICEACGFDFDARYGERGTGFMECHHIMPLAMMTGERKTHKNDLALVCANCHRIIHRTRPWLTVIQVKELVQGHS